MKQLNLILALLLFNCLLLSAQDFPEAFNYQGIATDINDVPIASTTIGL